MESTGLSISVIVVKMVEVGKEERGTKSKLTLLLPSHHSSARKIVSGKVAAYAKHSSLITLRLIYQHQLLKWEKEQKTNIVELS